MSYARATTSLSGSYLDMQRPIGMIIVGLWLSVPWQPSVASPAPEALEVFLLTDAASNAGFCDVCACDPSGISARVPAAIVSNSFPVCAIFHRLLLNCLVTPVRP